MIWLVLALLMFAVSFAGIAWGRRRARRAVNVIVPVDLGPRIEAATRAFIAAAPWQPSRDADAPETAAAIEAALIANDRKRALELAESAVAADYQSQKARVWLAWALIANSQAAAALAAVHDVPELSPFVAYLRARAEHLQFEYAAGATEPVPPLVTTADLAVVTLASGRGAATWLRGTSEAELSGVQAKAAVAEHRRITARCLENAIGALEGAPGFADAAYLVARVAVKGGLLGPARALFDALAPRMTGRPDADAFERDRKDLADPAGAVAAAKAKPVAATAKRSRSLKVLSE